MVFNLKKSLAGPGYVILNGIRVINIIALLAVVAGSAVMLVRTAIVSSFFFFDALLHVLTIFASVFLIVSEVGLFKSYFARNWPLLAPSSGFVTLGVSMLCLAALVLGSLNKEASSEASLGTSFYQVIVSSGIVVFIVGVINIAASYLFQTRSVGVTARMVRAYGAVAPQKVADVMCASSSSPSQSGTPAVVNTPSVRSASQRTPNRGPGDLPSYHPPEMRRSISSSRYSSSGLNISGPVTTGHTEHFASVNKDGIARPESAHHPAFQGGRF